MKKFGNTDTCENWKYRLLKILKVEDTFVENFPKNLYTWGLAIMIVCALVTHKIRLIYKS